jgi:hypothetical protein
MTSLSPLALLTAIDEAGAQVRGWAAAGASTPLSAIRLAPTETST